MINVIEICHRARPRRKPAITVQGCNRGVWGLRRGHTGMTALVLAVLPMARAQAGVEYVTRTSDCQNHVVGAGQVLTVIAGPNMRFEVWGNSIDLSNPSTGFSFTGPANASARIVSQRSGVSNQSRGCGFVGSAVIELDSPGTLTSDASASVSFRIPLGDQSRFSITIKARPTFTTTWTTSGTLQPSALPCIVKTGSITALNQDTRLTIQLPPGHSQDQTTCTSNTIRIRTIPSSIGTVSIDSLMKYAIAGLPAFLTASQPTATLPVVGAEIVFTFNVAAIRALTAQSTSTITITDPVATSRSTTLTLVVTPDPGQGFAAAALPNPTSTIAGNPMDFRLTLSAPAAGNQVITWRMTSATCFRQEVAEAPYSASAPFQFFVFPRGQTSANIRVRSVNNAGCTNKLAPVTHVFEAWIGDARTNAQVTAVTTGPTYTRANVSLTSP